MSKSSGIWLTPYHRSISDRTPLRINLVAKFVKMDGEKENITVYGDTLMYGGVKLKQAFSGNGYNENVRYFQDFGARMYFMEEAFERSCSMILVRRS